MRAIGAFLGVVLFLTGTSAGVVSNGYTYNSLAHTNDLNGIGQTFSSATPSLLNDAAILLCAPDPSVGTDWWPQAHLQVRLGLPGNFDGTSGNILFNSTPINFNSLTSIGTAFDGGDLSEARLSDWGFTTPLPLLANQTYSLLIVDSGTTGVVNYAQQTPDFYPGEALFHTRARANNLWNGPVSTSDLPYKLVLVPEPSTATIACGAALMIARRQRRLKRFSLLQNRQ